MNQPLTSDQIANLKALRKYLEAQPDENTNLDEWRCGTQFCIAGHATNMPEFDGDFHWEEDPSEPPNGADRWSLYVKNDFDILRWAVRRLGSGYLIRARGEARDAGNEEELEASAIGMDLKVHYWLKKRGEERGVLNMTDKQLALARIDYLLDTRETCGATG